MRRAVSEKFSENLDCVLDLGEIENLQEMHDIRHVLLALVEVRNPQGLELQCQHVSGGWHEHGESDLIAQSRKRTQRAEMKVHRVIEPCGRPTILPCDAINDVRKPD